MIEAKFPHELLDRPKAERLKYFRDRRIKHPALLNVLKESLSAIRYSGPETIIILTGTLGAGKSTLLELIEIKLTEELLPTLEKDPGRLAFLKIQAGAPINGKYDWRDHFRQFLLAANEPCVDRKIDPSSWRRNSNGRVVSNIGTRSSIIDMQHGVEQLFLHRKPVVACVDDAQHIIKTAGGRKLSDHMDIIKSVTTRSHTPHFLSGTFDLLPLGILSGQTNRRTVNLYFPRYDAKCHKDIQSFKNVVRTFQSYLPLKQTPDLEQHWEYLFEGSLGCVGVLADWLAKALGLALDAGGVKMTRGHLRKTSLMGLQREIMLAEAINGEQALAERKVSRSALRRKLGLAEKPVRLNRTIPSPGIDNGQKQDATKKNTSPGRRRAKRDKTGKSSS
jgi:hypothetical protein